ncbi:hypothetical protein BC939DRAFT_479314 [Gamsiella multidivaricata]|uniref:uncharacterized protein n=1 Tax=Gamsiella multidivaricata TaxID=101098 RepID=UPI00222108AB|nr:uncharacterized protein BC939DRAFT_479314 [Gamsiella multidivaricata]KAI7819787.1 hypothetical protein BC939DRAFT_479314 [Gamsiella multidivaricata]
MDSATMVGSSGSEKEGEERKSPRTRPSFSPFVPTEPEPERTQSWHNDICTCDASGRDQDIPSAHNVFAVDAALVEGTAAFTRSAEISQQLVLLFCAIHPTITLHDASDTLFPTSAETTNTMPSLASTASPSPQRLPLQHRYVKEAGDSCMAPGIVGRSDLDDDRSSIFYPARHEE